MDGYQHSSAPNVLHLGLNMRAKSTEKSKFMPLNKCLINTQCLIHVFYTQYIFGKVCKINL